MRWGEMERGIINKSKRSLTTESQDKASGPGFLTELGQIILSHLAIEKIWLYLDSSTLPTI